MSKVVLIDSKCKTAMISMNEPINILICGDRNWTNEALIRETILNYKKDFPYLAIIQGCASGADSIAAKIAKELNIPLISTRDNPDPINNPGFPAKWKELGKRAGPERNKQMLTEGRPNIVIAFHNNLSESKGTKNMVYQAEKANIPVFIVSETKNNLEEYLA